MQKRTSTLQGAFGSDKKRAYRFGYRSVARRTRGRARQGGHSWQHRRLGRYDQGASKAKSAEAMLFSEAKGACLYRSRLQKKPRSKKQ